MKILRSDAGSIIALGTGLILILLVATMGALNVSYLVSERFKLQTELDALALQLVQQIDYDEYFITGFTDSLRYDYEQIDNLVSAASVELAACGNRIATAISGLTIDLTINCQVSLPLPLPGITKVVVMQVASSARLAQAAS